MIEKRKLESQFSPGQRPHNKGKKIEEWVTGESLGKIKSTYFKKGHKPHNTRQDEAISIRVDTKTGKAYKYKKVDDSDWQLLSRLVWEENNGPIPEGNIIIFKNGDTMDTAIENLQCMTRKQALTKNREGFENLPPELKRTIQLKNRLTRKIKHQWAKQTHLTS